MNEERFESEARKRILEAQILSEEILDTKHFGKREAKEYLGKLKILSKELEKLIRQRK